MTGDQPLDDPTDGVVELGLGEVVMLPSPGDVFQDARGGDRWMRATWHPDAGCVVLSLWRGLTCIATMRVARDDVPDLVQSLVGGLVLPAPPPR